MLGDAALEGVHGVVAMLVVLLFSTVVQFLGHGGTWSVLDGVADCSGRSSSCRWLGGGGAHGGWMYLAVVDAVLVGAILIPHLYWERDSKLRVCTSFVTNTITAQPYKCTSCDELVLFQNSSRAE